MSEEYELGQTVKLDFGTWAQSTWELTQYFQSAAGGTPTFELRKRSDNSIVSHNPPTVAINTPKNGRHQMTWDTSQSTDAVNGEDYDLYILDGRVSADGSATPASWTSVVGERPVAFSIANRAAGFLLERSLKMAGFTVQSVVDARQFEISGQHIVQTPNFYNLLNLAFDPGAANFSRGGVVRSSGPGSASNTLIELIDPLPVLPQPGETGAFLPEERPREQYWADIRADFSPTDTYSARWYNGTKEVGPDSGNSLITIRRLSDSSLIANGAAMSPVAGSNTWRYETAALVSPNESVEAIVTAVINNVTRSFPRTLVYSI